jgi:hypothetical protein
MLCKIWGFHGGDYEECRLLWYRHPVRSSQETHNVSATDHSRLMLCKIWCFHGGNHEECRILGMLRRVALVTTDVSEERRASTIRVKRIGELWTSAVISNRCTHSISSQLASVASYGKVVLISPIPITLMMEALRSSETYFLRRATRRNIPEDGTRQSFT